MVKVLKIPIYNIDNLIEIRHILLNQVYVKNDFIHYEMQYIGDVYDEDLGIWRESMHVDFWSCKRSEIHAVELKVDEGLDMFYVVYDYPEMIPVYFHDLQEAKDFKEKLLSLL